jgi:hypothetical protein
MRKSVTDVLDAQYWKTDVLDQRIWRLQHFLIDLIVILYFGRTQADRPFEKCGSSIEYNCASAHCNGTGLAIKCADRARRDRPQHPAKDVKREFEPQRAI